MLLRKIHILNLYLVVIKFIIYYKNSKLEYNNIFDIKYN